MKTTPKSLFIITLMVLVIGTVNPAAAYVGPGAGLSLLGALWGLLLSLGAALLFVILWPLRRIRKRARQKQEDTVGKPHGTV
jgi:Na+-driven multidrug efflux pump